MPSKNIVKQWDLPSYYHVYNRGAGGNVIFSDSEDKYKFLSLIKRYIRPVAERDKADELYPYYPVEVLAYCLMGSHFHLLLYQEEHTSSISDLMKSVSTSYTMYRNRKYKSQGHLFQSIFKASQIRDEAYFKHITCYIHMNPRTYKTYKWSSIGAYIGDSSVLPVNAARVNDMSPAKYLTFLEEYESNKAELELLKEQLAL